MIVDQALKDATAELAATAGIEGEPKLQRLRSNGDNRLLRVEVDGATFLLKRYFAGTCDRRDRVRREFAFARYAWSLGVHNIPQPIAADYTRQMALFRFVDGSRLTAATVTREHLDAAVELVWRINHERDALAAQALPPACGRVRSMEEHRQAISTRLADLAERADGVRVDAGVRDLIDAGLRPAWARIAAVLPADSNSWPEFACLTPSDFGFHNAIIGDDGRLYFHDFEHSGWDDPERLVAELFASPLVPIALSWVVPFAQGIAAALDLPDDFVERAARLIPLYRVYSCCALLDEILPGQASRMNAKPASHSTDTRWTVVQRVIADLHALD